MKIISENEALIEELYADMDEYHLPISKEEEEVPNAQGMLTIAVIVTLVKLGLDGINTLIKVLKYFDDKHRADNKHFIHLHYKDGTSIELENLSIEKRDLALEKLTENIEDVTSIKMG